MRSTTGRPFSVREGRSCLPQGANLSGRPARHSHPTARTADVFAYFSADAQPETPARFHRPLGIPARFSTRRALTIFNLTSYIQNYYIFYRSLDIYAQSHKRILYIEKKTNFII